MRKIKSAVVRFPGGCFADSYDWRDGVGPTDKRPRRQARGVLGTEGLRVDPRQDTCSHRRQSECRRTPRNRDLNSGRAGKIGSITTLSHSDIHAYNSFQHRDVVVPQNSALKIAGSSLVLTFPPASVGSLQIGLV